MPVNRNPYSQYANNKIMGASPAELTLMLYEGTIKFCNQAKLAIESRDIEKAHNSIIRSEQIIAYLQETLDMKYPVAKDFDNVYNYLMTRLREANIKKDSEILDEVLTHLRTMRDTWKKVMAQTAGKTRQQLASELVEQQGQDG
jgi:flagellar protein FliS